MRQARGAGKLHPAGKNEQLRSGATSQPNTDRWRAAVLQNCGAGEAQARGSGPPQHCKTAGSRGPQNGG